MKFNPADPLPSTWVAKLEGAGVLVVILGAIAAGIYGAGLHAAHQVDAPKIAAARDQARTAQAQSAVTTSAAGAAEHTHGREAALTTQAEEAARAVQSAPGADAPLPADVLRQWSAGIDGLREPPGGPGPAAAAGASGAPPPVSSSGAP